MRKRHNEAGNSILAAECEAYLDGRLAEYWEEKGIAVPVWAWTNLLAHGTEGSIGGSVLRHHQSRRVARSWRIARSFLAAEVLNLADAQLTLTDLQASVLIPLELEMAARSEVSRWTPRRWMETVDCAIRNQRSSLEQ